ncbi:MAG: hypothetical protein V4801_23910 [Burkholderia gladioli]
MMGDRILEHERDIRVELLLLFRREAGGHRIGHGKTGRKKRMVEIIGPAPARRSVELTGKRASISSI